MRQKLALFSADPQASSPEGSALLEKIELMVSSLSSMNEALFTPAYCAGVLQRYPVLNNASLSKALQPRGPVKAARRRNDPMHRCEACGGILSDGSCSACGHVMYVIEGTGSKSKSTSDTADKLSEFEDVLLKLLAQSPMPAVVCEKKDAIVAELHKRGVKIVKAQLEDKELMRACFAAVKLAKHYIWCNAMWYHISGWRPKSFSVQELKQIREYYSRAVQAFFKRMNSVAHNGKQGMSNLWSVQAILRMIILSSSRLLTDHYDFYESLHALNPSTERTHTEIWGNMGTEEGWVFA